MLLINTCCGHQMHKAQSGNIPNLPTFNSKKRRIMSSGLDFSSNWIPWSELL